MSMHEINIYKTNKIISLNILDKLEIFIFFAFSYFIFLHRI